MYRSNRRGLAHPQCTHTSGFNHRGRPRLRTEPAVWRPAVIPSMARQTRAEWKHLRGRAGLDTCALKRLAMIVIQLHLHRSSAGGEGKPGGAGNTSSPVISINFALEMIIT